MGLDEGQRRQRSPSADTDHVEMENGTSHADEAVTIRQRFTFVKILAAMGSLGFNTHLQSNSVSYLNDAPFLQLYII